MKQVEALAGIRGIDRPRKQSVCDAIRRSRSDLLNDGTRSEEFEVYGIRNNMNKAVPEKFGLPGPISHPFARAHDDRLKITPQPLLSLPADSLEVQSTMSLVSRHDGRFGQRPVEIL
jgi:hypothetical protein